MTTQGMIYNIQRMSTQDGPGLRTTVFFKGCPLACRWCSNPESQARHPQLMHFGNLCTSCGACAPVCAHGAVIKNHEGRIGRDFSACVHCGACAEACPTGAAAISGRLRTVEEVMEAVRKDAAFYFTSDGGVTFSGGECTMQGEFLLALMGACHDEGVHCAVDTCGQTEPGLFARVLDEADLLLFDIKHMDSAAHKELTGVGNELIQRNLRTALAQYPDKLCIRIPLMPGLNDGEANVAAMADLLLPYGVTTVNVLPCHRFGSSKYEALSLPQPGVPEYTPGELRTVLSRFEDCGLRTEIV